MRANPPSHHLMLKHVPALLSPDALHALASMGHGDALAIVDAHFPAARIAAQGGARLVHLPGADTPALLAAVLALLPLDEATPEAAWTMEVIGDATAEPPAVADIRAVLARAGERESATLERGAFYAAATRAFAIFQGGETRTYGNVLLTKGVVGEPAR
jgi:L-fucose mutarotase